MLHELLMSLLGKPGSIIKQIGTEFKVDACSSILTSSEANMINEICQTGYYYAQLLKFIEAELTETCFADLKKNASVYRKAMAQGLRRAI
jgi:DNA-binding IscR family transcriptional regulator